jgi:hypothetical protein
MFDKFGEFDSAKEINKKAAQLKVDVHTEEISIIQAAEEALKALAVENGMDPEDAEDYLNGVNEEFCTTATAALGKLRVEKEELKLGNVLLDWVEELEEACLEDPKLAAGVRKEGRGLDGYIARLADEGYSNMTKVDRRIVARTKKVKQVIGNREFGIGIPDKATRARIMKEYYLEGRMIV